MVEHVRVLPPEGLFLMEQNKQVRAYITTDYRWIMQDTDTGEILMEIFDPLDEYTSDLLATWKNC